MDPYQQYPAPAPAAPQGNPYEFIMAPQKPHHRGLSFGNGNLAVTIGAILGGATILIILVILLANIFGGGGGSKADLISLTQSQNELVRISQKAETNAVQQTTKNLAITVDLSLTTQQQALLRLLAKNGVKVDPKDLKLKQNGVTDQQLSSAKATSTFDPTYTGIMQTSLQSYVAALKQLHAKTSSKTERTLTSEYITQTELLISQIPYNQ